MVSPLAAGKQANWQAVAKHNTSGIVRLSDYPEITAISNCKIGGVLTRAIFDPNDYPTSIDFRTSSLASALASQTLEDAALSMESMSEADKRRTGIVISNQYGV